MSQTEVVPTCTTTQDDTPDTCWQKMAQQRLKGKAIFFTANWAIFIFFVLMLVFGTVGGVLWHAAAEIIHDHVQYGQSDANTTEIPVNRRAVWNRRVEIKDFPFTSFTPDTNTPGEIWVQYELSGFHQNHRRYRRSVSHGQLSAAEKPTDDAGCLGWKKDGGDTEGKTWYPCGLIARSVFSDRFMLFRRARNSSDPWMPVKISEERNDTIPDDLQVHERFQNAEETKSRNTATNPWIYSQFPPQRCTPSYLLGNISDFSVVNASDLLYVSYVDVDGNGTLVPDCNYSTQVCNFAKGINDTNGTSCAEWSARGSTNYTAEAVTHYGVESTHLINWFYLAGFPNFRKNWGVIKDGIPADSDLKVVIFDNFEVASFSGMKYFTLTTTNWLGTRNQELAIAYFSTAGLCLLSTIYLTYTWVKRPRFETSISLDFVRSAE